MGSLEWWIIGGLLALVQILIGALWLTEKERRKDADKALALDIEKLSRRSDALAQKFDHSPQSVLAEKVRRLEQDYELLHLWKRSILPADLDNRASNVHQHIQRIEARIDRLERKVFNGDKDR